MTLIGAFVVGGILLIIAAVVLLGAGSFTGAKPEAIAYFDDSVSGLDIGAPVKFRGVTIGNVSQVLLHTSGQSAADYSVPVVMEFAPDLLTRLGGLINQQTVHGARYGAQSSGEVDTESF